MRNENDYIAITRVRADGTTFLPGSKVEGLSDSEAAEMLAINAVRAIAREPERTSQDLGGDGPSQEQAEADAAARRREKAATKAKAGREAWAAAESTAQEASGYSDADWGNLADSDRVARIEAVMAGESK